MVQQLSPAAQYQQNQISLGWTIVVFSVQAQWEKQNTIKFLLCFYILG